MNQVVVFDVGANLGQNSLHLARQHPNVIVHAFEPVPELINHLKMSSIAFKSRYHIHPIALNNVNGMTKFNVAANDDRAQWGCSSLNNFKEGLDKTWPDFDIKFDFTHQIDVEMMTFKAWYENSGLKLTDIHYFHCDTQGSDLKVLSGMEEYIDLIHEGMIECASDEIGKLYEDSHTVEDAIVFMRDHGFAVVSITPNDPFGNEFNMHFKNKRFI